ncbi:NAD(P)-binding protein [Athelia psychrophila]|uniref:NAD(P)-binding protein n=1 Tax=Athelia psychrophila TaxID=1759441 RepID=A0A166QR37_9AGAM|nr:NAD(P)-binding protein [Fibularhizoctonia sp. CBS 109695]
MGIIYSTFIQTFPPRAKWSTKEIPDLSGKVAVVTGANTGIGWETAKALLEHNAKVYIAARSPERAHKAIEELKSVTGKQAYFLKLDLADLKSVKAAAAEFNSKEPELHILFNNGGVMAPPVEELTADGYDLQFGTNVLGHFYFTKLLLPALLAGTKTSDDGHVRVVNTSSLGHLLAGLDFNTFKDSPARKKAGTQNLYAQSKNGNVVFATELARRYGVQGIVSTSLHPGYIGTDLARHFNLENPLIAFVLRLSYQPWQGALTQLYAGTSPEGKDFNGKYLIPFARLGSPHANTRDPKLGEDLWTWLEEQTEGI